MLGNAGAKRGSAWSAPPLFIDHGTAVRASRGPRCADYSGLRVLDEPFRVSGEVVKGFGRGSKELGIPTANLPIESLGAAVDSLESGVYFGWAALSGKGPFKMVMSVGW